MRSQSQGSLLYDAGCGICSRLARSWAPTLHRYGFAVAPLQSAWLPMRTGLSPAELLRDVRLLRPDGQLTSGPDVYRYIMRRIWWAYPAYLVSRAPVLRRLFDWGYRSVARHRQVISRRCGLATNPGKNDESTEVGRSHG